MARAGEAEREGDVRLDSATGVVAHDGNAHPRQLIETRRARQTELECACEGLTRMRPIVGAAYSTEDGLAEIRAAFVGTPKKRNSPTNRSFVGPA